MLTCYLTKLVRVLAIVLTCSVPPDMYDELSQYEFQHGKIRYHKVARIVSMHASSALSSATNDTTIQPESSQAALHTPTVVVVTAGTTDMPVSEEAAVTLEAAGVQVDRVTDVGVAGLHRILQALPRLQDPRVVCVIVCAGMDGALPSVVGGLVSVPVVAVPTSVGYGASFGGISAMLTMLNSCR
jgi:pyridinium-3,5-biscarboxylic acid mononucleotide synthase